MSEDTSKKMRIDSREHDLGGGFTVKRLLPFAKKRMVGPFIFLDHIGPVAIAIGQNTDVRPHPHIGLSTLTYLFEGRMVHRDSLGFAATIAPGEVNWMTAGRGISHSERAHEDDKTKIRHLHGLQFWVALPDDKEDIDPSFEHYKASQIPQKDTDDYQLKVICGEAFGLSSPVAVSSPLIFAEFKSKKDHRVQTALPGFESAIYVVSGEVCVNGEWIHASQMETLPTNMDLNLEAKAGAHFVLIGGEAFATPRHIWWNLVSSNRERIEAVKKSWKDRSFPQVPGETEFIPLPDK